MTITITYTQKYLIQFSGRLNNSKHSQYTKWEKEQYQNLMTFLLAHWTEVTCSSDLSQSHIQVQNPRFVDRRKVLPCFHGE